MGTPRWSEDIAYEINRWVTCCTVFDSEVVGGTSEIKIAEFGHEFVLILLRDDSEIMLRFIVLDLHANLYVERFTILGMIPGSMESVLIIRPLHASVRSNTTQH